MNLFVYGTLIERDRMVRLIGHGRLERKRTASVPGYVKYDESATRLPYPVALRENRGRIEGVLWGGLTEGDIKKLDGYEGVEGGLYKRVEVLVETRDFGRKQVVAAYMYIGTEERWGYIKNAPASMVHSVIRRFEGYLPRWIHEAMDEEALIAMETMKTEDGKGSVLVLLRRDESSSLNHWWEHDVYEIEARGPKTQLFKIKDEEGNREETTFEQLLRTFDHN